MIISEKGKFIFVHVHKTAGISIEETLLNSFPDARVWHGRHGHARDGIKEIGQKKWEEYFSFSFVRNPFDRLVSWYSMIEGHLSQLPANKRESEAPFDSPFWNHAVRDANDFDSFLTNCTKVIKEKGCLKSYAYNQLDYLSDDQGNNVMSFVGRFENLATDIDFVFDKLGIVGKSLGKRNTSAHTHYSNYYKPSTRELIAKRFERDMTHFGYQFEEHP